MKKAIEAVFAPMACKISYERNKIINACFIILQSIDAMFLPCNEFLQHLSIRLRNYTKRVQKHFHPGPTQLRKQRDKFQIAFQIVQLFFFYRRLQLIPNDFQSDSLELA